MPAPVEPSADDLLDYLGLTGVNYPLADAEAALEVATELQAELCDVSVFTWTLREARLRRGARTLAARGALLGYTDLGEFGGPVAIQRWDAQVESLEAPYRSGAFA